MVLRLGDIGLKGGFLGFRVWGFGFRVLGFRVVGVFGFRVHLGQSRV